tara:strand:- start:34 stop:411 length:378 start_codon:yes stop_codon:yes gene_type:complete
MSKAHTFTANVKCDQGWSFKGAFVAIYDWSQSTQETGTSSGCDEEQHVDSAIEAIAYSAVFWQSLQDQVDGLNPRPLINPKNPDSPHLFSVDLSHLQSLQVINNQMTTEDKRNKLIQLDVSRNSL